ncbi:phosphopantetheine-binding protein [Streptomyces sp. NPDC088124]|uniref:acyl carrier protein n=1 Tax=Streptomyces sp. NPDC088124 TaxID=3154654 RepID=UPI003425085E
MNRSEALDHVSRSIRTVVPDADFDGVSPDADLRETFELDSLDFLSFVETLGERTGCRIDEDDYPALATLSSSADFLLSRAG